MAENVTNELMYELLKQMNGRLANVKDGVRRVEADVRSLKSHMGDFLHSEARQDGELAEIRARIERIETRLELRD